MGEATLWGMIDAQLIVFPLVVDDLNAATLVFSAPLEATRSLVPGHLFEVLEVEPGTAQLTVAVIEYRRGSWGAYNGFSVAARGRPVGVPDAPMGAFVLPSPVSDRFGCEAAHRALGMPGSVEDIDVTSTDDLVTVEITSEGRHAATVRIPRVPSGTPPGRIETVGYSEVDGGLRSVRVEFDVPTGLVQPDEVKIELGTGRLADTLRSLGLPRRPELCTWGERLSAVFHQGERVPAPQAEASEPSERSGAAEAIRMGG
jgi:hypothetical protein